MVYLPTWMVDFYGINVGKYASPMDLMGYSYEMGNFASSRGYSKKWLPRFRLGKGFEAPPQTPWPKDLGTNFFLSEVPIAGRFRVFFFECPIWIIWPSNGFGWVWTCSSQGWELVLRILRVNWLDCFGAKDSEGFFFSSWLIKTQGRLLGMKEDEGNRKQHPVFIHSWKLTVRLTGIAPDHRPKRPKRN